MEDINNPILNDFYIYFYIEYILNYELENWNYYLQKKHFTNNSCEGYNSKLLRLFDYKNLHFGKLFKLFLMNYNTLQQDIMILLQKIVILPQILFLIYIEFTIYAIVMLFL